MLWVSLFLLMWRSRDWDVGWECDWLKTGRRVFGYTYTSTAGRTYSWTASDTLTERPSYCDTGIYVILLSLFWDRPIGNQSVVYADIKRNRIYVLCTCVCVCLLDLCEMGNKFHVVRFKQHGREDSRSDFHGLTNRIVLGEEKRIIEF